jgi:hypothetical protein
MSQAAAFEEYPPWEHGLKRCGDTKSYVMHALLTTKPKAGGSNYERHDPTM